MKSYSFDGSDWSPDQINYAVMEYDKFEVREVLIGRTPKHEYHIRIKDGSSLTGALEFFRKRLGGCEVGLVDPSFTFTLDYPIYVKVESEMMKDVIKEVFDAIDAELGGNTIKE